MDEVTSEMSERTVAPREFRTDAASIVYIRAGEFDLLKEERGMSPEAFLDGKDVSTLVVTVCCPFPDGSA